MATATEIDVWADVVGQPHAIAQLTAAAARPVHSYLLVGPSGSGKRAAARARSRRCCSRPTARARRPSDISASPWPRCTPTSDVVEATTAQGRIDAPTAKAIVKQAALSPAEGARKVLVLEDFHRIDQFGGILLKYVEEPPPSTFFVILAEDVPPELVTIASRSVRIDLGPVPLARRDRPAHRPRASTRSAPRRWRPRRPETSSEHGSSPRTSGSQFAPRPSGRCPAGSTTPAPAPPSWPLRSRRSSTTRRP